MNYITRKRVNVGLFGLLIVLVLGGLQALSISCGAAENEKGGVLEIAESFAGGYFLDSANSTFRPSKEFTWEKWLKGGLKVTPDRGKAQLRLRSSGGLTANSAPLIDVQLSVKRSVDWENAEDRGKRYYRDRGELESSAKYSGFNNATDAQNAEAVYFDVEIDLPNPPRGSEHVLIRFGRYLDTAKDIRLKGKQYIQIERPAGSDAEDKDPEVFQALLVKK